MDADPGAGGRAGLIIFTQVYNGSTTYGSLSRPDYTDAGTFTGLDPDAALDASDEIAFMVKDAGEACPACAAAKQLRSATNRRRFT